MDTAILVLILIVIGMCVFIYFANKTTSEFTLLSRMDETPYPYKVEPPTVDAPPIKLRRSTIEALAIAHGTKDSIVKKPTRAKRAKQTKRAST